MLPQIFMYPSIPLCLRSATWIPSKRFFGESFPEPRCVTVPLSVPLDYYHTCSFNNLHFLPHPHVRMHIGCIQRLLPTYTTTSIIVPSMDQTNSSHDSPKILHLFNFNLHSHSSRTNHAIERDATMSFTARWSSLCYYHFPCTHCVDRMRGFIIWRPTSKNCESLLSWFIATTK